MTMKIAAVLLLFAASACRAEFTVIANNVAVEVGEDAIIPCSYQSDSGNNPVIEWSTTDGKTRKRLFVYTKNDESSTYPDASAEARSPPLEVNADGSLLLKSTTLQDNIKYGRLYCEVSLGSDGLQGKEVNLTVALLPKDEAQVDINKYADGKSGFDMMEFPTSIGICRVSRSYPQAKINFYKNGETMSPDSVTGIEGITDLLNAAVFTESTDGLSGETSKDFTKRLNASDHQADFVCHVVIKYGDKMYERNYTMPKFNVNYETSKASFSDPPVAYLGSMVKLKCTADGYPEPTISIEGNTGGELEVNVTKDLDGKSYGCSAYNSDIQMESPVTAEPFIMEVLSLSQPALSGIEDPMQPQNFKVGDKISIDCTSEGNPTPTVSWTKGEQPLKGSATLSIASAKLEDSGTYVCHGSNGHEKLMKETAVEIVVNGIVRVDEEIENVEGKKDEKVTLTCSVDAHPMPSFEWNMDNDKATPVKTGGARYTSQLEVGPLTPELSKKEYTCTVTGYEGEKLTKTFMLPEIAKAKANDTKGDDNKKEVDAGSSSTAIIVVILILILVVAVVLAVLYHKGKICKKSEEKGDESAEGDIEGGMNNDDDVEAGNGKATEPADGTNDQPVGENHEEEKLMPPEDRE